MDPAELLHTARWHAGLTQAEVASRAGTSQQTLARYETGAVSPNVATLRRLVAACGMHLTMGLVPQPGLEDAPTRELLAMATIDRLSARHREPLLAVGASLCDQGVPFLVAGKAGARLHGAVVRVYEIDLWFPFDVDQALLLEALRRSEVFDFDIGRVELAELELEPFGKPVDVYREGPDGVVEFRLQMSKHFGFQAERALLVRCDGRTLLVAGPDDLARPWHPRDRDHLALQRAGRLARELAAQLSAAPGPESVPHQG